MLAPFGIVLCLATTTLGSVAKSGLIAFGRGDNASSRIS